MYSRIVQGEEHTFGVSGKLIMNALVMYDHQTRSLWSQFLGRSVKGEFTGLSLDFVPVTHTTWSAWLDTHPDTLVLDKGGRYQRDTYDSYYRGNAAGVIVESQPDFRLHRKALVVGVDFDGSTKAYPFDDLQTVPTVNDTFGGQDILVFLERGTDTALVFDRAVDGELLTFEVHQEGPGTQALLRDLETGSTWMALTGVAVDGPLKGVVLERVPSFLSFWFAWSDWNPDTELFEG